MKNKSNSPILICRRLQKIYQDGSKLVPVLEEVNLTVELGTTLAIVGRSGSGKTTLINLLGGLELPTTGEVELNGFNLLRLNDQQRGTVRNQALGFIFQFHHLLPEFSALENICMPLLIRGMAPSAAQQLGYHYLEQVSLQHRATHRPGKLSGGERQRVAIARALVTQPQCILADEPTGNLDPDSAEQIYQLLMGLVKAQGSSLIVVTHDYQLANRMDRIVQLEKGLLTQIEQLN
jgi:lipoprotein-releasing system ATP-binding protein